eukprot:6193425-Pleurochrysis_carterae.AAC.1
MRADVRIVRKADARPLVYLVEVAQKKARPSMQLLKVVMHPIIVFASVIHPVHAYAHASIRWLSFLQQQPSSLEAPVFSAPLRTRHCMLNMFRAAARRCDGVAVLRSQCGTPRRTHSASPTLRKGCRRRRARAYHTSPCSRACPRA